jgi:hypothetical protein
MIYQFYIERDQLNNMGWGQAKRPKVSSKLGNPNPREGGDGDVQIKGTGLGTKLFVKGSGRWWDVPLSIDGVTKIGVTDSDYLSIDRDSVDVYKNSVKVAEFGEEIKLVGAGGTEVFTVSSAGKVTINPTSDTTIGLDVAGDVLKDRIVTIRSNSNTDSYKANKLYLGTSASADVGTDALLYMYDGGGASDRSWVNFVSSGRSNWKIGHTDNSDNFVIAETLASKFILDDSGNGTFTGMIGHGACTHVFGSGTGGVFTTVGASWESLVWDTDKYALVTFVVPTSNKVKISVHLPRVRASGIAFQLGLATDSSATSLGTKYENDVNDATDSDLVNMNYSWVVEGSDHSWTAGQTKTIYIMAYATSNIRFYTGGTNTSGYGGVIVEATALHTTMGDGSEP